MMMIRKVSTGAQHPAENLSWQTASVDARHYAIHTVAAAFSDVTVPSEVTTSGQLNDIELGYVCKTGRFVPMTQQYMNP